jgi:hypothetical protein
MRNCWTARSRVAVRYYAKLPETARRRIRGPVVAKEKTQNMAALMNEIAAAMIRY